MRVNFTVSGGDDLQKRLNELPSAVSLRVQVAALKQAARPIRDAAAAIAPRDEQANAPHMADNIIIAVPGKATRDAESLFDQAVVEVGPSQPFFYGFFQEIGTAFHPAQPFMRPAFDANHAKSLAIAGREIWGAIRKRLGLGGGRSASGGNL